MGALTGPSPGSGANSPSPGPGSNTPSPAASLGLGASLGSGATGAVCDGLAWLVDRRAALWLHDLTPLRTLILQVATLTLNIKLLLCQMAHQSYLPLFYTPIRHNPLISVSRPLDGAPELPPSLLYLPFYTPFHHNLSLLSSLITFAAVSDGASELPSKQGRFHGRLPRNGGSRTCGQAGGDGKGR